MLEIITRIKKKITFAIDNNLCLNTFVGNNFFFSLSFGGGLYWKGFAPRQTRNEVPPFAHVTLDKREKRRKAKSNRLQPAVSILTFPACAATSHAWRIHLSYSLLSRRREIKEAAAPKDRAPCILGLDTTRGAEYNTEKHSGQYHEKLWNWYTSWKIYAKLIFWPSKTSSWYTDGATRDKKES